MSYAVPAMKTLSNIRWATPEQHKACRALISGKVNPESYESVQKWIAQCYNTPRHQAKLLLALNEVYETHGVECIWADDGAILAEYLNTGDTYESTLIYRHDLGRFQVSTMGDLVEMFERRGVQVK